MVRPLVASPPLMRLLAGFVLALALIATGATVPTSADAASRGHGQVRATTTDGKLKGTRLGNAEAFLGVPYAAPPVKDLRFTAPQPVTPWRGTRAATSKAPACLQFQPSGVRETQATSEDCLYLDVYRPRGTRPGDRLPVVFWVHGGGYTQGTGVIYGGQTLASRTDSVVVSINYRVGALGYLALGQLDRESPRTGSGNWGLLDQIAALEWVRANAAALGGDPRNITIDGQSAGGSSICTLLTSPRSAGLFQRAIIQSAFCGLGERPLKDAQASGSDFAKAAGCSDDAQVLACLRKAWVPNLVAAFGKVPAAGPVTGTPVLPRGSTAAIEADDWNKVPVVIGAVAHEGKLFLSGNPNVTATDYQNWLTATYGSNASKVAARYPLADYPAPFYAQAEAFGDQFLYCGVDRTAKLLATKTKVYRYEFDDPNSPTLYGFQPPGIDMSSTHSAELAYLFDFTLNDRPVPASSRRLADQMKRYWGSFAEDANPNVGRLARWPSYSATGQTLVLRPTGPTPSTTVSQDHECGFWANPDAAS